MAKMNFENKNFALAGEVIHDHECSFSATFFT